MHEAVSPYTIDSDAFPSRRPLTTAEQIAELQATRTKILTTGQAYTADGLQMTRANLRDINAEIARLEGKASAEAVAARGSGISLGYFTPVSS